MSIEESTEYTKAASKDGVDTIFLVSPNTDARRIRRILSVSTGFLYLVAVFGTTGIKTGIKGYTLQAIKNLKGHTRGKIPVGVGFGISTPNDVKRYVSAGADAVIVGSAYLKLIKETPQSKLESAVGTFTTSLKRQTIQRRKIV